MTILVTGGAGFVGSNFVLDWLKVKDEDLVNLDCLTYAGNLMNLESVVSDKRYCLRVGDITDSIVLEDVLKTHRPRAIVHFAAESHVDRSISAPEAFIQTNIVGTFRLLESARKYWERLPLDKKAHFRFLHVSTDEVYGTLAENEPAFCEESPYAPNSPYSASKAASDHLVRSYYQTYSLPVLTTNCSNNYGPFQLSEKLIPLVIHNALRGKSIPVYGNGLQIRDWLYVRDHCAALMKVLEEGRCGEVYNVGGRTEKTNLEVVRTICGVLNLKRPSVKIGDYAALINFVNDRPGHDRRYAVDTSKLENELGWAPMENFNSGIEKTIDWYLSNSQIT